MTGYTAIDGDIAGFAQTQLALAPTFQVAELRRHLLKEGHPPESIHAALERWWGTFFVAGIDGAKLTADGKELVARLNKGR